MEHDRFKEWLHLSVFDELDGDEKRQLEVHVQSCEECRREREGLVQMLESITKSGAGELSEEALLIARQRLSAALWNEPSALSSMRESARREPVLTRLFGAGWKARASAGRGGWLRGYRLTLAGAAALCVGFFLGYLAFGRSLPVSPVPGSTITSSWSPTEISNVHFLDADAADGDVEILYDQVRPVRVKARMDDRRVRKLLAHAIINGDNPGVRLEAMSVFETSGSTTPTGDVKGALLEALISDPNAGVRRQALLILQQQPFDDEIKRAMFFVLQHDENPGMRIAAMNYLTGFAVDGVIPEQEIYDILDTGRTAGQNRPGSY